MRKLLPVTFFTIILTLFLLNSGVAAAKKIPAKVQIDSSKIDVRKFDANALKKFRTDKDFFYGNDAGSWWGRFWHWLWHGLRWLLKKLFGWLPIGLRTSVLGLILQYLFYALVIAFVVYIISKSMGIDVLNMWKRGPKQISIPYTESLENIHEINFDNEIEKAIAQHNYRLAVRLLYLKCLKQLSDAQLIQWQIDKTNSAYFYELISPVQKEMFGILTRQFEYVWYGNFAIDQQAFGNINQLFQQFKKQLP